MFDRKSFTEPLTGGGNKAWYIAPRSCSGRAFSVVAEPIKTSITEKCFDVMTEGTERFLVANRELNTGEVLFDGGGGCLRPTGQGTAFKSATGSTLQ